MKKEKKYLIPVLSFLAVLGIISLSFLLYLRLNGTKDELTRSKSSESELLGRSQELGQRLDDISKRVSEAEKNLYELTKARDGFVRMLSGRKEKFSNTEIGISFEYPAELGAVDFEIQNGETGKQFLGSFTNAPYLNFGGMTKDFSAGRSSTFLDFADFNSDDTDEYPGELINTFRVNGGTVYLFEGEKSVNSAEDDFKMGFVLQNNYLGALINLRNRTFSGLAFENKDPGQFPSEKFDALLKSFVIR